MVPIKLNWIYCEDAKEFQEKLKNVKGQLGIYVWIMKKSTPHRVFYVGEGDIWTRTLSHFEESISGRWMIFCWGFKNGDYLDFLGEKVSGKDIKTELNKSEIEMGKEPDIVEAFLIPDKIRDRIDYISNNFSYAFAVSEEINHKHKDTRQTVEALLITKLREYYTTKCPVGKLKNTKRPLDYIVGGIKSSNDMDSILIEHGGESKKLPEELQIIKDKKTVMCP